MFDRLLDSLYRVPASNKTRMAEGNQMEILCLGLSYSDTDSLKSALETLGYSDIYHRSTITSSRRADCRFWVPLLRRKYKTAKSFIPDIPFDTVLGNFQAVMDSPACVFGEELITYYPKAKVILNRRREINAWYSSVQLANSLMFGWTMWLLSWFGSGLYWIWRTFMLAGPGYFDYDFHENGKTYGKVHYVNLKDYLKDHQREYLEWSEEDGWEPLCAFLGKPVPKDDPFPAKNQPQGQITEASIDGIADLQHTAIRNLTILAVPLLGFLWYYRVTVLWVLVKTYKLAQVSREKEDVFPEFDP